MNLPKLLIALALVGFFVSCDKAKVKSQHDFTSQDAELHYVILPLPLIENSKLVDAKRMISDYNQRFRKSDNLKITDIYLNPETKSKIILIRRFSNKMDALNYVREAKMQSDKFINLGAEDFDIFAITQSNYREVIKQKSIDSYRKYYDEVYGN